LWIYTIGNRLSDASCDLFEETLRCMPEWFSSPRRRRSCYTIAAGCVLGLATPHISDQSSQSQSQTRSKANNHNHTNTASKSTHTEVELPALPPLLLSSPRLRFLTSRLNSPFPVPRFLLLIHTHNSKGRRGAVELPLPCIRRLRPTLTLTYHYPARVKEDDAPFIRCPIALLTRSRTRRSGKG
jgi:hypothetical protein